ncbi:excinuclease ABC subunit UvrA [Haloferula rosea]|uniref:UvrABC system protein A n=1 Tax=Haloferula rosea TaxID=490093 RepID=A0A934VCD6_9BACT|nr:excinuclease ABC subunit UvrA [Haloferula rosea]MBK1828333.1 excinuclease ABC subunit UvrA [Haloferula rosea]
MASKKRSNKSTQPATSIQIRGARQHNLKGLDLDIPLGQLTVVTGPSGSGKSSLAFHTLYAEGQRRYVETFSPYVRQFFDRMDKPDVERIDGIPPAIAIEQKNNIRTTRSTVGTLTELNDYLKLLFARTATGHDPKTGEIISPDSPESAASWALDHLSGEKILVTFPVPIPPDTPTDELFPFLNQQGYLRVITPTGEILRTDDAPASGTTVPVKKSRGAKKSAPVIQVVQDRLTVETRTKTRLLEALEAAFSLGKGDASIISHFSEKPSKFKTRSFSTKWENPATGTTLRPPTPSLFSFNNPVGACPTCRGFGRVIGIALEKAVPDPGLTLSEGAIKPFQGDRGEECQRDLIRNCKERDVDIHTPWGDLDEDTQEWIYYGDNPGASMEEMEDLWRDGGWYGVKGFFDWMETKAYKMHVRVFLSRFRSYTSCSTCRGRRLQPEALCFRIDGKTLPDLWQMPVNDLHPFLTGFQKTIKQRSAPIELVLNEITSRLGYLDQVGLGYLTLDRPARTLSGGEIERVNLTSCLGASLSNTLFVLDEPTVGLHARDIERLVKVMHDLRDKGNTLVVVEHEETVMRAADQLLDIGPGSGESGGTLIFQGPVNARPQVEDKPAETQGKDTAKPSTKEECGTLPWLSGRKKISVPASRRPPGEQSINIMGATRHNLRKLDAELPLGLFVCLTGVSGSGKSTLAHDVLHANLLKKFNKPLGETEPAPIRELRGSQYIDEVLLVDQSPLARTPRSTPAVLLGAFNQIRQLFAQTADARARNCNTGFFSFNSGEGRCDRCAGAGFEKVEMQFLSDLQVTCPDCSGRRYKPSTLDILYRGKSIAEVLEMTIDQALEFYGDSASFTGPTQKRHAQIRGALRPLSEVGLGYIKLGQPLNTLSGGESQRLKLCQILAENTGRKRGRKGNLLILDEPTTGLHFTDIERLLGVFQRLVDNGHSLLVIEHNLDVIKSADWIMELGPGAGADGGQLVAEGTPEDIARLKTETARYLKPLLVKPRASKNRAKDKSTDAPAPSTAPAVLAKPCIQLRGAREHNLKNVDIDIPRDEFVVVSGLSGSGKSTLAFDILFAEGQRRFLDSMSAYARQFAEQLEKPDLDLLNGLPPTVAIEQRVSQGGMKSTVATVTELWNFIRLLYAKLGTRYCPDCDVPVEKQSIAAIEKTIRTHLKNGPVAVMAPIIRGRKGYHTEIAEWALKQGFSKLLVDRQFKEAEGFQRLTRYQEHDIDVVVAEIDPTRKPSRSPSAARRTTRGKTEQPTTLPEAIERALEIGKGTLKIFTPDKKLVLLSTEASCPSCNESFDELDPRLFSFNSPYGWCLECRGHGRIPKRRRHFDASGHDSVLAAELDADRKVARMDDDELVDCPECHGTRLNPESRAVRLDASKSSRSRSQGLSIAELSHLSVHDATGHFTKVRFTAERDKLIARDVLPEITQRLDFLNHVGLGYLQLDRSANTLSGGESQRIRLAAQLGSNLRGVLYVLDEPTIGLHPRDNSQLLDTLIGLRDRGNSLIVVEHDEDTIAKADHLIDLGPAAGRLGGEIVYQGAPPRIGSTAAQAAPQPGKKTPRSSARRKATAKTPTKAQQASPTYQALTHPITHPMRGERRTIPKSHKHLKLTGCTVNNLDDLDVAIPIGRLTVLTGISGSGKSTLMHQCIAPVFSKSTKGRTYRKVTGQTTIKSCYTVDQSPIGKTSRSCPATYVKVFDDIRKLFAQLPEARMRGYEASRFSFNTGDGRCPTCEGNGRVKLEMDFLPTTWIPCDTCNEQRYNPATLEIRFRGKNIGEVLHMTIEQAAAFFESQPRIATPLQLLADTGLGYLQLGQPSPTVSGGEAQRIKLVSQLIKGRSAKAKLNSAALKTRNLYLIEEPTVGLHLEDVRKLIDVLHRLVDEGHTVIVIEHHMAVAAEADWILDLGPEGGEGGGKLVTQGSPEKVAASKRSRTAPFLRAELA